MLDELERTVVIDGVEYVAEEPEVECTSWYDRGVLLSGFHKKGE